MAWLNINKEIDIPTEIKVCHCKQCRGTKERKNPSLKKRIKRMLNRSRRKSDKDVINFYWA